MEKIDHTLWASHPEGRAILKQISKPVVEQVAPEEVEHLDEFADEFLEDPTPPDLSADEIDEPLALGIDEVLVFASPGIFAMLTVVVSSVTAKLLEALGEKAIDEAVAMFLEWLKKKYVGEKAAEAVPASGSTPPALPRSLIIVFSIDNRQQNIVLETERIEQVIYEGRKYGLSEEQAASAIARIAVLLQSEDKAIES